MKQRLSNSKWDRAAACPSAFVVDGAIRESSEDADVGTSIHGFLELAIPEPHRREEALELVPPVVRVRCDQINTRAIHQLVMGAEEVYAEWGFAWHPDEGVIFLGCGLDRDYSKRLEGWIPGTLDLVAVFEDRIVVADYKSGHAMITAAESRQLRMGAIAACDHFGSAGAADVFLVYIDDDGGVWPSGHSYDAFDLEEGREEARKIIGSIQVAEHEPEPYYALGGHCRYCEVRHVCGAQSRVAMGLIETSGSLEAATPEELGQLYEMAKAISSAVDKAQDFLKKRAKIPGAIILRDGSSLEMVEKKKDEVLAAKALKVVSDMYGPEAVLKAATVTKAGLERAIPVDEETGKPPKGAKAALIKAVREAGGIEKKPYQKMEIVKR